MAQIYLALYKNKRSFKKEPLKALADSITRFFTKGKYSHCEIAVLNDILPKSTSVYTCYSSSVQDGGVRQKVMNLPSDKWDLAPLRGASAVNIAEFFAETQGRKYDWWGALGIVLGIKQKRSKFFCSEWCAEALGMKDGWRFSPNDLAAIYGK